MPDKTDKDGPFPAAASTSESSPGTPDLREIEFERIQRKDSNVGPNEAKQGVIRSWDDFDTFFDNKTVDRPAVDFNREQLIAVSMGKQTSSGFSIQIVTVQHGPGFGIPRTYVEFIEKKPAPGQIVSDVLTYPTDIVKVPILDGSTKFSRIAPKGQAA